MTYNIYKKKIYINTPHKRKEKRKRNVNREEFEKKKKRKGTEYTKNVEKLSHVLFLNLREKNFTCLPSLYVIDVTMVSIPAVIAFALIFLYKINLHTQNKILY